MPAAEVRVFSVQRAADCGGHALWHRSSTRPPTSPLQHASSVVQTSDLLDELPWDGSTDRPTRCSRQWSHCRCLYTGHRGLVPQIARRVASDARPRRAGSTLASAARCGDGCVDGTGGHRFRARRRQSRRLAATDDERAEGGTIRGRPSTQRYHGRCRQSPGERKNQRHQAADSTDRLRRRRATGRELVERTCAESRTAEEEGRSTPVRVSPSDRPPTRLRRVRGRSAVN
jgi:hypothetical protein